MKMVKQLRNYVRSCDSLEQEIIQKEQLRMKLTSMAMEVCNIINEDTRVGLSNCETEARRKIEFILQVFQQASEGHANHSLPEEFLIELRNNAKTQLEFDVLELTNMRKVLAGLPQSLEQPSLVSSLSGSDDSYMLTSPKKKGQKMGLPVNEESQMTQLLPAVKQPFREIREKIKKNKGDEVLRAKLGQLKTIIDHYNPKLRIIFDKLRSEREDEEFDPDNPVQEPDEPPEIINAISTLNAVKHLQLTTAETVAESISLVSYLLSDLHLFLIFHA